MKYQIKQAWSQEQSRAVFVLLSALCTVHRESLVWNKGMQGTTHTYLYTLHIQYSTHMRYISTLSNFPRLHISKMAQAEACNWLLALSYLKMPSVWAPPRARTYWESWTCTQGSFLSGKSSLCLSITSSRELPNREGVMMARLLWSISSKVGLRSPLKDDRWGKGRFTTQVCQGLWY